MVSSSARMQKRSWALRLRVSLCSDGHDLTPASDESRVQQPVAEVGSSEGWEPARVLPTGFTDSTVTVSGIGIIGAWRPEAAAMCHRPSMASGMVGVLRRVGR